MVKELGKNILDKQSSLTFCHCGQVFINIQVIYYKFRKFSIFIKEYCYHLNMVTQTETTKIRYIIIITYWLN